MFDLNQHTNTPNWLFPTKKVEMIMILQQAFLCIAVSIGYLLSEDVGRAVPFLLSLWLLATTAAEALTP